MKMPSVLGGRPLLWGNVLQAAGTLRQHSACKHSTWWAFSTPSQERAAGRQRPGVQCFYTCKQECRRLTSFSARYTPVAGSSRPASSSP